MVYEHVSDAPHTYTHTHVYVCVWWWWRAHYYYDCPREENGVGVRCEKDTVVTRAMGEAYLSYEVVNLVAFDVCPFDRSTMHGMRLVVSMDKHA